MKIKMTDHKLIMELESDEIDKVTSEADIILEAWHSKAKGKRTILTFEILEGA